MSEKKDFMPMVYEFKNVQMEKIPNTDLFISFEKLQNLIKCLMELDGQKDPAIFLTEICWFGVIILIIEC